MNRITSHEYKEAIYYAYQLLPLPIANMLQGVHFLTGTDPVYAGLHRCINTHDGRSYRNTAHVNFPGKTTIVLPKLEDACPYVIIHELGHCLDEILGFAHIALPINDYAKTNRLESFAESFAAQYFWLGEKEEVIFQSDKATQYLFEKLVTNNG